MKQMQSLHAGDQANFTILFENFRDNPSVRKYQEIFFKFYKNNGEKAHMLAMLHEFDIGNGIDFSARLPPKESLKVWLLIIERANMKKKGDRDLALRIIEQFTVLCQVSTFVKLDLLKEGVLHKILVKLRENKSDKRLKQIVVYLARLFLRDKLTRHRIEEMRVYKKLKRLVENLHVTYSTGEKCKDLRHIVALLLSIRGDRKQDHLGYRKKRDFNLLFCGWDLCRAHESHLGKFRRCSGCHLEYYCCEAHQAFDWHYGGHKEKCKRRKKEVREGKKKE